MRNPTDKIKQKALKIYALSIHGQGGEREAAKKALERYLTEHNLSLGDITGESETYHTFSRPKNRILFDAVVFKVLDKNEYSGSVFQGKLVIKMTDAQKAEIDYLYSIYSKDFKEQMFAFTIAYLAENKIHSSMTRKRSDPGDSVGTKILEQAELLRGGIVRKQVRKAIEQ